MIENLFEKFINFFESKFADLQVGGVSEKRRQCFQIQKTYKKASIITTTVIVAVIGIIFGTYSASANSPVWFSTIFSLDKTSYDIGEKVTLTSSRLSQDQRGEVVFTQPNGKIHHTYPFDGLRVNTIKHSFRILPPSNDCIPTDMLGTWEVSFRMPLGLKHDPISFEVTSDSEYGKELKPCSKK